MIVVTENAGNRQAESFQWTGDVFAGHGMPLHCLPFFRSKVSAFFQDLIRDGDFSQVVQVAATAKRDYIFFLQQEMTAQVAGVFREALTMAFGIRIAALDAEPQGAEDTFCSFEFFSEFLEFEKRLH